MYSSVYGPPMGRTYIGRDSNGYRAYGDMGGGSPSAARRYLGGASASNHDYPPSRYRPPLPTYTMQSVSRSSSYADSANHTKSSLGAGGAGDMYANSR